MLKSTFDHVPGGIAVFFTNDSKFREEPNHTLKRAPFAMNDGIHSTDKHWPEGTGQKTIDSRPGFTLSDEHTIEWNDVTIDTISYHLNILGI